MNIYLLSFKAGLKAVILLPQSQRPKISNISCTTTTNTRAWKIYLFYFFIIIIIFKPKSDTKTLDFVGHGCQDMVALTPKNYWLESDMYLVKNKQTVK